MESVQVRCECISDVAAVDGTSERSEKREFQLAQWQQAVGARLPHGGFNVFPHWFPSIVGVEYIDVEAVLVPFVVANAVVLAPEQQVLALGLVHADNHAPIGDDQVFETSCPGTHLQVHRVVSKDHHITKHLPHDCHDFVLKSGGWRRVAVVVGGCKVGQVAKVEKDHFAGMHVKPVLDRH
ncbi:hypothetical protein H257_03788 [Aphanomyces astaci]|uniref:Uncharacterized protein n=1 Tax=Aphanomyces astaci TaxID=112090 RepID=W4GY51_APHAT|nr:hypothetical protein H257_03788 [Aphanomyces astaci]ETV84645.1 hypothetical protein H257_03788 [Aphanomyces astaci]|eukprot:XP_009826337.1 hypothetical protein H257_03788 [Aphanomyces astaci]